MNQREVTKMWNRDRIEKWVGGYFLVVVALAHVYVLTLFAAWLMGY